MRGLLALADAVERVARDLREAAPDDRLAASYPFLTMCAVLVAGWLLERIAREAAGDDAFIASRRAAANYFVSAIVPEAIGLEAAAGAGAEMLYAVRRRLWLKPSRAWPGFRCRCRGAPCGRGSAAIPA